MFGFIPPKKQCLKNMNEYCYILIYIYISPHTNQIMPIYNITCIYTYMYIYIYVYSIHIYICIYTYYICICIYVEHISIKNMGIGIGTDLDEYIYIHIHITRGHVQAMIKCNICAYAADTCTHFEFKSKRCTCNLRGLWAQVAPMTPNGRRRSSSVPPGNPFWRVCGVGSRGSSWRRLRRL